MRSDLNFHRTLEESFRNIQDTLCAWADVCALEQTEQGLNLERHSEVTVNSTDEEFEKSGKGKREVKTRNFNGFI